MDNVSFILMYTAGVTHLTKISMDMEGPQSWENQKKRMSPEFHPDPNKTVDPVEKLLEEVGPEGAFDELMDRLDKNPGDIEARRQANLLVNRLEDLSSRLRGKIQH